MLGLDITVIAATVVGAILGAAAIIAFGSVVDWFVGRFHPHRGVRFDVVKERGPASREYGFTEAAVKVTIRNESGHSIQVRNIHLMIDRHYGVPVLKDAPPARSHPELPASLGSGTASSWYFGAEKLSTFLRTLYAEALSDETTVKLRPRVTTTTGKTYLGSYFQMSLDPSSHWP